MTPLDALYRAQRAWEATQPQLFMELWPDSGLDEARPGAPRLVEPATAYRLAAEARGGLNPGAEPRRLGTDGLSHRASPPVSSPPRSGGSAPHINTTGPDAPPAKGARPAQEVTS